MALSGRFGDLCDGVHDFREERVFDGAIPATLMGGLVDDGIWDPLFGDIDRLGLQSLLGSPDSSEGRECKVVFPVRDVALGNSGISEGLGFDRDAPRT